MSQRSLLLKGTYIQIFTILILDVLSFLKVILNSFVMKWIDITYK